MYQPRRPCIPPRTNINRYFGHYEEDDTDCASEQAVQILEPENALELLDAEIGIYLQEFRTFLVHLEYAQPLGLGHRRQNAHERAPVNHGKT
jgi:hypothetical protein